MIIRRMMPLIAGLTLLLAVTFAQIKDTTGNPVRVALVKMPYVGERNVPELSGGPDYLEQGGLRQLLEDQGVQASLSPPVALSADEDKACGSWNRLALANGDLAKIVADERRNGHFPVGLLANCSSILGMLSGLQHSGPTAKPLRVGMVFVDAHGDFNTPETTLSGMLGGMPVAIASGQCLTRMRLKAGLEPPLPTRYIVEICVRDTDPLEQELLDRSEIQRNIEGRPFGVGVDACSLRSDCRQGSKPASRRSARASLRLLSFHRGAGAPRFFVALNSDFMNFPWSRRSCGLKKIALRAP